MLIAAVGFISCGKKIESEETLMATMIAKNVSVEEFNTILHGEKPVILLDVRTDGEVAAGKIEGAVTIDLYDAQFSTKIRELDRTLPVLIYCRSGNRSTTAMKKMEEMGFIELYNLTGGIIAWSRAGLPVVKP
jgi:rhodanese-related sulfurtransferase